jgi:hypothetical protein
MHDRRRFLLVALAGALAPALGRASERKGDKEKSVEPRIDLPTLSATVIRPNGRRGVLTVQATLLAEEPAVAKKAALSRPRLMNAYVAALQIWAARQVPGAAPNVDLLTQVLQAETDRVVGKGARFLLGGVMVN